MKDTYPTVLPKSRIGQTIEYAFTLLPRLSRYVNDGRISIDNNPVERAIRPLVLEKKPALLRQWCLRISRSNSVLSDRYLQECRHWTAFVDGGCPQTNSILPAWRSRPRGTPSQSLVVSEPTLTKLLRLVTKSRLIATNQNKIATRASPKAYNQTQNVVICFQNF